MTHKRTESLRDIKGASVLTTVNVRKTVFDGKPELLPCVFYGFTMSLVRSSASRIYLTTPTQEQFDILDKLVAGLPPLLASRVKIVDRGQKVFNALQAIINPLVAEGNYLWDKEFPDKYNAPIPKHEHTVCILFELIYMLVLGQMYGAEVDFDLTLAQHCVARLKKRISSSEASAALARLEGIVHAYSNTSEVSSLVPLPESEELRTGSLLQDLLEDARWLDASAARYEIGILGRLRYACNTIRRKLTELLRDPTKQKYLSLSSQVVKTAAEKVPIPLPVLISDEKEFQDFSPPLNSLRGLKPHCIATDLWFPFSPSEIGTALYDLKPQPELCPVGFMFDHEKGTRKGSMDREGSNKPD